MLLQTIPPSQALPGAFSIPTNWDTKTNKTAARERIDGEYAEVLDAIHAALELVAPRQCKSLESALTAIRDQYEQELLQYENPTLSQERQVALMEDLRAGTGELSALYEKALVSTHLFDNLTSIAMRESGAIQPLPEKAIEEEPRSLTKNFMDARERIADSVMAIKNLARWMNQLDRETEIVEGPLVAGAESQRADTLTIRQVGVIKNSGGRPDKFHKTALVARLAELFTELTGKQATPTVDVSGAPKAGSFVEFVQLSCEIVTPEAPPLTDKQIEARLKQLRDVTPETS